MKKYPELNQEVWAITSARVNKKGVVVEIIKKTDNQDDDQYIVHMLGVPMTLRFKLSELLLLEEECL